MTLVLCKLLGAGTDKDPHRLGFPTYTIVAMDTAAGLAIADVPIEDCPPDPKTKQIVAPWAPGGKADVLVLAGNKDPEWQQEIRSRYPEGFSSVDIKDLVAADV